MATVRVRDKHQITLPRAIAEAANVTVDDTLTVEYTNGVITLVPAKSRKSRVTANDFLGALRGSYGKTVTEINSKLRAERDSWPHFV